MSVFGMVDDTRLEPAGAGASARRPQSDPRASRAQIGHKFEYTHFQQKEQPPCWVAVLFGGRYKTRTCDLPHVKRMRYQLRQSSIALSAWSFYFTRHYLSSLFSAEAKKDCFFLCAPVYIIDYHANNSPFFVTCLSKYVP